MYIRARSYRISLLALSALAPMFCPVCLPGQGSPSNANYSAGSIDTTSGTIEATSAEPEQKRLFGVIPNFRTSPTLLNEAPLTAAQKFKMASQDSLDRGTFILAGLFAGESQLAKSDPSFGNGAAGYGRYFGTAYADFAIGDMMTEAIFPTMLREDPRYYRKGEGSTCRRLRYAILQLFRTRTDKRTTEFNYSEVLGNATAVAISNAYYPDNRNFGNAATKLGLQLGVDGAANIIKEFAPDIYRHLSRRRNVRTDSFTTP